MCWGNLLPFPDAPTERGDLPLEATLLDKLRTSMVLDVSERLDPRPPMVHTRWCSPRVPDALSIEQGRKWGDKMHEDLDAAASPNFPVGRRPLYVLGVIAWRRWEADYTKRD